MTHHIVEASAVTYAYPDKTSALNGVSFRIEHGESVALVGANGAGKSTLLLHLNGVLMPSSGTIRIGDFPLTQSTMSQVRRSIGMVFQDPDDQLFMPTVFDDVAFGPFNMGLSKEEVEKCVINALETVGCAHLKERPPYRLSGGEKRLVAIAAVLAMSPDVLVMDEPSSNLDPASRRHLIDLLANFAHTRIIATHDLDLALDLCERTIILKNGKVAADGKTVELLQDIPLLVSSRLEQPSRLRPCLTCGALQIK